MTPEQIDNAMEPHITKPQAKSIMGMALDLEKTGRLVSLAEGQERSDFVARNRGIQCALEDYLNNLVEAAHQKRKPLTGEEIHAMCITVTNQPLYPEDEQLAFAFVRAIERAHGIGEKT